MDKELLDLIAKKVQEYSITPQKGIIVDSSIRHIARKISIQDGDKEEMINSYLEEVKRSLLLNITQYEVKQAMMLQLIFKRLNLVSQKRLHTRYFEKSRRFPPKIKRKEQTVKSSLQ